MGYMHIENLYKNNTILLFKQLYAMEKIHGTSAHISWNIAKPNDLHLFPGGEKLENFQKTVNQAPILEYIRNMGVESVVVYGEAYGGKCQGMKEIYGPDLKFIVFDISVNKHWMTVPKAHKLATDLGLEFVDYVEIPATIEAIDAERDKPSVQAIRNGMGSDRKREGVVLRPLIELEGIDGRVMAKHKQDWLRETKTPRPVNEHKLAILTKAQEIADEYVVMERLNHVLDRIPQPHDLTRIGAVLNSMVEDIYREAKGEIVEGKDVESAIKKKTAEIYRRLVVSGKLIKDI